MKTAVYKETKYYTYNFKFMYLYEYENDKIVYNSTKTYVYSNKHNDWIEVPEGCHYEFIKRLIDGYEMYYYYCISGYELYKKYIEDYGGNNG